MRINHFLLAASISFAMAFVFSCSSGDDDESGNSSSSLGGQSSSGQSSSSDCEISTYDYELLEYGGKTYRIITIGDQTWMANNLNVDEGGECYNNNPANCEKYGRLYNWATAMDLPEICNSEECASEIQQPHRGICPQGWHIPSNDEWKALLDIAGGSPLASTHLKAISCWNENGNGQDTHRFAALPGGKGYGGNFGNAGYYGYWWSSEESSGSIAFNIYMNYNTERAYQFFNGKEDLFSVRCVQDQVE
jgi:uncharacterized protein (TIGR02145 family)